MDTFLNLRFIIAAGIVLLPLAVLAYLVFSTKSHEAE
jgi:hypothetical protein